MAEPRFVLSAFGDEIADDLDEQLELLSELGVGLDLRGAWGTNVLHLSDSQVEEIKARCADYGITIHCIGSPIGKSPLAAPIKEEIANLDRIMTIADRLGTRNIRLFSFYPDDTSTNAHYDQYVPEVVDRLGALAETAEGFQLLHENEKEIVGDTPARCEAILRGVNSPRLRMIWDPANFVQVGVEHPTTKHWSRLAPYVTYIHIKDALLDSGDVRAAGEGDGEVAALLERLSAQGYQGVLSLEPHLAIAGHSSGFSGPDGMRYAVKALRRLLVDIDVDEVRTL